MTGTNRSFWAYLALAAIAALPVNASLALCTNACRMHYGETEVQVEQSEAPCHGAEHRKAEQVATDSGAALALDAAGCDCNHSLERPVFTTPEKKTDVFSYGVSFLFNRAVAPASGNFFRHAGNSFRVASAKPPPLYLMYNSFLL